MVLKWGMWESRKNAGLRHIVAILFMTLAGNAYQQREIITRQTLFLANWSPGHNLPTAVEERKAAAVKAKVKVATELDLAVDVEVEMELAG